MTTTTLTAAQSASSSLAWVAAAGPRERGFLIKIDDEYELVDWRGDQFARPWQVERGVLGSTPAAHSSSATVSINPAIGGSGGSGVTVDNGVDAPAAVTTLVAAGAVIAGSSATLPLTLQQIGPFAVAFDDAGVQGDGKLLAALAAGTLVTYAWFEALTQWVWPGAGSVDVAIAPESDPTDWWSVAIYRNDNSHHLDANGDASVIIETADGAPTGSAFGGRPLHLVGRPTEAARLVFIAGSSTAGTGRVYAIIATPAA